MLSGSLNRLDRAKRRLNPVIPAYIVVPTATDEKNSTAQIAEKLKPVTTTSLATPPPPAPPSLFTQTENVLIVDDKVEVNLPVANKFLGVNIWKIEVKEFANNQQGFQEFVTALSELGAQLDNRIDSFDNGIANIQTSTMVGTGVIQILQLAFAAAQTLNNKDYTDFQTTLATVMAGLSLLAKGASSVVTSGKTDATTFRTAVSALEVSQNVNHTPLPAASTTPSFVAVPNALIINGTEVDVTLPKEGSGCILKSWSKESDELKNTVPEYYGLVKTLFKLQNALENEAQKGESAIAFVQTLSSGLTSLAGLLQGVVVPRLSTTGTMVFQITIAALNSAAVVGAKAASNSFTTLRNNTLSFSADVAELLAAQLKR